LAFRSKFSGKISTGEIDGQKIIVLKPETYMNLSGNSVLKTMAFYKIKPDNIVVIHDDIDIPFGKIKTKKGGGAGGHNGLKSIDSQIGKEYHRIRIGVGRPKENQDVANYVLKDFSKAEFEELEKTIPKIADNIKFFIKRGGAFFINKLHQNKKKNNKTKQDTKNEIKPKKEASSQTSLGLALKNALFGQD
jgi:PTH1 family peptidyl-tRNA hydrolase